MTIEIDKNDRMEMGTIRQADSQPNVDKLNNTELETNNVTEAETSFNEITNADPKTDPKSKTLESQTDSPEMVKIKKIAGTIFLVAFFIIILGGTCIALWPSFFNDMLMKQLVLSPDSTSYKMWVETPVPMYLKIRLYNWTNHHLKNEKPHFVELGPYVFREVDYKVNKVWNQKNSTVTFQQKRVWHFEPSMSDGTLEDYVTNLNPIAATIAYTYRYADDPIKFMINVALKKLEKVAITKTVREILFDGYDDVLLELAKELNRTQLPFDKFAWFYNRNNSESYDGTFNMLTGFDNNYNIGIIKEWKFKSTSPYYSETCGNITGTNGDLWPPLLNNKTVSVFSPDICTTLTLKADGTKEWLGLTGSKFISDEDMLDNGSRVESRKCYCENVECQPSGTLNVSSCKFGAPAFVSLPHFYLADDSYTQNISGMNPEKEEHEFELVVHPVTGTPMQVRAALQINFLVQSDPKITYFKDLPRMYVPMLWFTQEVNLTTEYAKQINLLVLATPLGTGILGTFVTIGVLLFIISLFLYFRQRIRDEQNQTLIPKDNQSQRGVQEEVING